MKKLKPVRLVVKKPKAPAKEPIDRLGTATTGEELTGFVNGMEASSYEERFARALSKNPRVENFTFREHYFGPARNTPGAIEIDFLVTSGPMVHPVQIDGEYAHGNQVKRAEDAIKDVRLNEYFKKFGNVAAVKRVPERKEQARAIFEDQEQLDKYVERLF